MKRFTLLCSLLCVLAMGLSAQESRGQIIGRVSDPSGAIIPGATVRAMNTGTNVVTSATTGETGDFTLPFLVAGDYEVPVRRHLCAFRNPKAAATPRKTPGISD